MGDRRYEGMNIQGATGLTNAQKATLKSLVRQRLRDNGKMQRRQVSLNSAPKVFDCPLP